MSVTLIIVILTAIVSLSSLNNEKTQIDLSFIGPAVAKQNQWYRFFSCALIHADIPHLAFNMLALYSFGEMVEEYFNYIFGGKGTILYVALYVISQFLCLLPTFFKHKDDYYYRSLGASGAVSAVIFAGILLSPLTKIGIIFIPIGIPGFIFGFLYLAISYYLDRKGGGQMNHSAHIFGAIAGIGLLLVFDILFSPYNLLENFIAQIRSYA
jgi:membrane associated rhomboid family serine protease